jgi:hypothetical protein
MRAWSLSIFIIWFSGIGVDYDYIARKLSRWRVFFNIRMQMMTFNPPTWTMNRYDMKARKHDVLRQANKWKCQRRKQLVRIHQVHLYPNPTLNTQSTPLLIRTFTCFSHHPQSYNVAVLEIRWKFCSRPRHASTERLPSLQTPHFTQTSVWVDSSVDIAVSPEP